MGAPLVAGRAAGTGSADSFFRLVPCRLEAVRFVAGPAAAGSLGLVLSPGFPAPGRFVARRFASCGPGSPGAGLGVSPAMTTSLPDGRDPPHTRQSPRTLAAFRPWGS